MLRLGTHATNRYMDHADELLTAAEVAERAKVTTVTVGRWARAGSIPVVRLPGGRSLRFRRSDVEAFLSPTEAEVVAP